MENFDGITVDGEPVEAVLIKEKDKESRRERLIQIAESKRSLRRGKTKMPDYRERHGRSRHWNQRERIKRNWEENIMAQVKKADPLARVLLACLLDGGMWTFDSFQQHIKKLGRELYSGQFSTTINKLTKQCRPLIVKDTSTTPYQYYLRQEALTIPLDAMDTLRKGKTSIDALSEEFEVLRGLKSDDPPPVDVPTTAVVPKSKFEGNPLSEAAHPYSVPERITVDVNVTVRFVFGK